MELNPKFKEEVKSYIRDWDTKHPVDYLWRKHFNIQFGSPEHLSVSFIDQHIWFEEQQFVEEIRHEYAKKKGKGTSGGKGYTSDKVDYRKFGFKDEDEVDKIRDKYKNLAYAQKQVDRMLKGAKWQTV